MDTLSILICIVLLVAVGVICFLLITERPIHDAIESSIVAPKGYQVSHIVYNAFLRMENGWYGAQLYVDFIDYRNESAMELITVWYNKETKEIYQEEGFHKKLNKDERK